VKRLAAACILILLGGATCGPRSVIELPIETGIAFVNLSREHYVAFRVREHGSGAAYVSSDLLAPGAAQRVRTLDALGAGCVDALDVQVLVYRRVNHDVPIGLDPGEIVESTPHAAGEVLDIPACAVQTLETFTIVNFDAPHGVARVKFAQDTLIDAEIRASGRFPNPDAAWEVVGVDPNILDLAPPAHAPLVELSGRVTLPGGQGVEDVGVMVRPRFRVRLNDADPDNDPDAGFGDPIDFTFTDAAGHFSLPRPAGAYQLEFFSDDFLFRPATLEVESPIDSIEVIVEPIP
jgi:hypothetical protein